MGRTLRRNVRKTGARARAPFSVSIQGELGAYSQGAVYKFFVGGRVRVMPFPTLQVVFDSLFSAGTHGKSDFAVVPIENSTAGSVGETIDLLISSNVRIVRETSIPVRHCLITNHQTDLRAIRKVMSHPQALSQCRNYLNGEGRDWQQIPTYDTAGSVRMIAKQDLTDTAAIASELAAEIYSMSVVRRGIEDDHTNATRFIMIEPARARAPTFGIKPSGNDKTTMIFLAKHEPGSLVRALRCFSDRGINLLKIESRPIRGRPWEYSFYIDVNGHNETKACTEAVKELSSKALQVKVLGSYPKGV